MSVLAPIVLQNSGVFAEGATLLRCPHWEPRHRRHRRLTRQLCGTGLRAPPMAVAGNLTSRLRFCAVAVSRTSSLAPLKPRSRSRSSLKMRFICANRISIFLRSRRDCWKASVLASARTRSRTSSSISRVTLRTTLSYTWALASRSSSHSCWPCSRRYGPDRCYRCGASPSFRV